MDCGGGLLGSRGYDQPYRGEQDECDMNFPLHRTHPEYMSRELSLRQVSARACWHLCPFSARTWRRQVGITGATCRSAARHRGCATRWRGNSLRLSERNLGAISNRTSLKVAEPGSDYRSSTKSWRLMEERCTSHAAPGTCISNVNPPKCPKWSLPSPLKASSAP